MKCSACGIDIPEAFAFAIKSNKCPSCGKPLMAPEYMSLVELVKTIVPKTKAEKIATLIMASFEVRKLSGVSHGGSIDIDVEEPVAAPKSDEKPELSEAEVKEAQEVMAETGIGLKTIDKTHAQAQLQKMRDEALKDALSDRYGMDVDSGDEVILAEDPKANAELLKQRQKFTAAQEKIASGGAGKNSFSRSA